MTFGERLKELRKVLNWTQEQMGEKIGCNKTTVSNYETGYSEPNIETLIKLSEFASVDFLLKGSEPEINKDTFGYRIQQLRVGRKWTQAQFADKIDVSAQVISNYERDYREPEFSTLIRIAKLFKVTTDYLLGYEVEK